MIYSRDCKIYKYSDEAKRKMSETAKGRTWKTINGKRVFFNKNGEQI
jgi:hypothetical protein